MWLEFKAFVMNGNLIDLAVAVILALAFGAVVSSFVADVKTPIIAAIAGQPDFSSLTIDIGDSAIRYGNFLNQVISFLIVAFVMFLIVKAHNRMSGPKAATPRECPFCVTAIPIGATRCPAYTSQLEGEAAQ